MQHNFKQLTVDQIDLNEVCEREDLIVVEYHNERCYHSSFAIMQVEANDWMMPIVISQEPTIDAVDNTLLAIQRGREMVTRLKLPSVTDAKKLAELGSTVYNLIDEIVHD